MKPHTFVLLPKAKHSSCYTHWPVCERCGLVQLRNPASDAAAAAAAARSSSSTEQHGALVQGSSKDVKKVLAFDLSQ